MQRTTSDLLSEINKLISQCPTKELPEKVLRFLKDFSGSKNILYRIYDDCSKALIFRYGIPNQKLFKKPIAINEGVTGYAARHRTPVYIENIRNDRKFIDIYIKLDDEIQSIFVIPLMLENRLLATLSFEAIEEDAFSKSLRKNILLISYNASVAFENCEKQNKLVKAWSKQRKLSSLLFSIYDINHYSGDITDILVNRLKSIHKIFPYLYCDLWFYNSKKKFGDLILEDNLSFIASSCVKKNLIYNKKFVLLSRSFFREVVEKQRIRVFNKVKLKDISNELFSSAITEFRKVISIPFTVKGGMPFDESNITGILNIYFTRDIEIETDLLELCRKQIDTAVQRLLQSERDKILNRLLEYPHKALSEYIEEIIDIIKGYGSEAVSIFAFDEHNELLRLMASTGIESTTDFHKITYKLGDGLTGRAALYKTFLIMNNLQDSKIKKIHLSRCKEITTSEKKNFICYPILNISADILGIIRCVNKRDIYTKRISNFSIIDINLLSIISKILSLYIQVEKIDKVKDDLLDRIPHDLKSPIIGIRNAARLILTYGDNEGYNIEQKLDDIIEECHILFLLINRVKSKKIFNYSQTSLKGEVLVKLIKILKPMAKDYELGGIYYHNLDKIPYKLFLDRGQMEILFYDLIINAIKYSYKHTDIEVYAERTDRFVTINIKNWGIGIKSKYIKKIFNPAFRTPEAIRKNVTGTGWGLTICKEIAEKHGGQISVRNFSTPTVISLTLPLNLGKGSMQ